MHWLHLYMESISKIILHVISGEQSVKADFISVKTIVASHLLGKWPQSNYVGFCLQNTPECHSINIPPLARRLSQVKNIITFQFPLEILTLCKRWRDKIEKNCVSQESVGSVPLYCITFCTILWYGTDFGVTNH